MMRKPTILQMRSAMIGVRELLAAMAKTDNPLQFSRVREKARSLIRNYPTAEDINWMLRVDVESIA